MIVKLVFYRFFLMSEMVLDDEYLKMDFLSELGQRKNTQTSLVLMSGP